LPLDKSDSKEAFSDNVSELRHSDYPEKQALAIAYSTKRKAEGKKSDRKERREPDRRD
jgi:hypothetical protein